MPHPQSPHRPSSTDVCASQDPFCAPGPLSSLSSLSSITSVSPNLPVMTPSAASVPPLPPMPSMATAVPEPPPAKQPGHIDSALMGLDDANATSMHWTRHNNLSSSHMGPDYHIQLQYSPEPALVYDYGHNALPYNDNYNLTYSSYPSNCPRSYASHLDLNALPNVSMQDSYPPAAYQIEPQKPLEAMELADQKIDGQLMQLSEDYDRHYPPHIKLEDQPPGHASPYDSDVTRCSTPHDEPPLPPLDVKNECSGDDSGIDKEQPYAQLIYRALMEQPNKTMILRDIYEWFKRNTDKAADKETKGWQNSIRHNLSMNGAFEKVDQPCEEPKKGFMWRLTNDAIREGVKSTTRYRSKQPNKRGQRSHNPLPQRQASGAKGGQAARRSAKRRSNRPNDAFRSEPYLSRSVPTAFEPAFGSETPMPYPPSPYYGSEGDFLYPSRLDDFGGTLINAPPLDLFSVPSYSGAEAAYILPQDPSEPMFTNSPSPTASESQPRTPESPGMWDDGMAMGTAPYVFDGNSYREYMG